MMKFDLDNRVVPVPFTEMEKPKWEDSKGWCWTCGRIREEPGAQWRGPTRDTLGRLDGVWSQAPG